MVLVMFTPLINILLIEAQMEKGKITISRVTTNQAPKDYIKIQVHKSSFGMVLQAEMELEEFAMCLTGLAMSNCKYKTFINNP